MWTNRVLLIQETLICITTVKSDESEATELRGRVFNLVLSALQRTDNSLLTHTD